MHSNFDQINNCHNRLIFHIFSQRKFRIFDYKNILLLFEKIICIYHIIQNLYINYQKYEYIIYYNEIKRNHVKLTKNIDYKSLNWGIEFKVDGLRKCTMQRSKARWSFEHNVSDQKSQNWTASTWMTVHFDPCNISPMTPLFHAMFRSKGCLSHSFGPSTLNPTRLIQIIMFWNWLGRVCAPALADAWRLSHWELAKVIIHC